MAESTVLLIAEVFPKQPVRQWVLSVPYPLRVLFASCSEVMGMNCLEERIHPFVCVPIRSGGDQCSDLRLDRASRWNRGLRCPRAKQEVDMS